MVDFFTGIFLATLIVALFTTRLYRLILWYSLHSLSLAFLALYLGYQLDDLPMIITGFATLFIKAVAIPYVLKRASIKFNITRQITPDLQVQYAIILIPAILVFTFYLSEPIVNTMIDHANSVAISIASLFLSLLLMMEHKNVMPKIIGFLMIENSLFLLGTIATLGMPMLVELGIFFDLLMAIVVMNLLFRKEVIDA